MKLLVRSLIACLLALWISAPTTGGEGGENAGGTGVWILPTCGFLGGPGPGVGQSFAVSDPSKGVRFVVSEECGAVTALAVEPLSGISTPLSVNGRDVTLPASLLQAYVAGGVHLVRVVITDAAHCGYRIDLVLPSAGSPGSLTIQ